MFKIIESAASDFEKLLSLLIYNNYQMLHDTWRSWVDKDKYYDRAVFLLSNQKVAQAIPEDYKIIDLDPLSGIVSFSVLVLNMFDLLKCSCCTRG